MHGIPSGEVRLISMGKLPFLIPCIVEGPYTLTSGV